MNSKNKEDGLSEISEKAFQESSIKLSDIIKLTNQTKSLMDSYNSLYNADKFQETVKRMQEGQIKFLVANNLQYYIQVMDRNILRYLAKKYKVSESDIAKLFPEDISTNFNLNPNDDSHNMQWAIMMALIETNPKLGEDYKNFREQLNLQLENNKAYQDLISLVVDPSKFEDDIKKIENLMKQVGDVIIAFDVKVLSETDPTFAKQDISPDITPAETITSDDIIRIAAKLNKDMELAPNEAKLYEDKKVKELVDKQREKT